MQSYLRNYIICTVCTHRPILYTIKIPEKKNYRNSYSHLQFKTNDIVCIHTVIHTYIHLDRVCINQIHLPFSRMSSNSCNIVHKVVCSRSPSSRCNYFKTKYGSFVENTNFPINIIYSHCDMKKRGRVNSKNQNL